MPSNTVNKPATAIKPVPGVSISLTDEVLENFTQVKESLLSLAPGIRPTNADVARYAFHLAAEACQKPKTLENVTEYQVPAIFKPMSEGVIGD
jgi:hypothetical protein